MRHLPAGHLGRARRSSNRRVLMHPASDLEYHVNTPGRSDLVRQVREKIDKLGITYIYYQFISVTGRIVGKGMPPRSLGAHGGEGLPARLWIDGQPLHRSPQADTSATGPSLRADRHSRSRDIRAAALGQAGRPGCSAPASVIARRTKRAPVICRPTAAAICASTTPSSRKSTTCTCAWAASRR